MSVFSITYFDNEKIFTITGPYDPTETDFTIAKEDISFRVVEAKNFKPELLDCTLAQHAMTVWEFDKAPPILQELASCGGDEDTMIYVPKYLLEKGEPAWPLLNLIEHSDSCRNPWKFIFPDGSIIYVGTH